jgi:hypothetical protein
VVDAVASGDVDMLKSDLIALGTQQAVALGRAVSGQLPIDAIAAAANPTFSTGGKRTRKVNKNNIHNQKVSTTYGLAPISVPYAYQR